MPPFSGPIPGDNPAGADLRYAPIYDDIKEARRADDLLDRGDWSRELKTADWDKVRSLAMEVLTTSSKDLQIAAWPWKPSSRKKSLLNRDGACHPVGVVGEFLGKPLSGN